MRILGIDPGFAITGYSIIDYIGNKFNLITSGAVTTKAGESFPLRLLKLNNDLENIIDEYKPDAISVEELFFKGKKQQAMEAALDELVNKLQLGAEQFETAALILRTESEAKEAARILKEKLENTGFDMENRFSYLHRDSNSFAKALQLLRFILQKVWNLTRYFPCSLQQIRA